jgi:hypothetical protein
LIPFFLVIGVPTGLDIPLLEGVLLMLDSLDLVFFVTIGPVAIFFFIGVRGKDTARFIDFLTNYNTRVMSIGGGGETGAGKSATASAMQLGDGGAMDQVPT